MTRVIQCPTCGKAIKWDKNNPHRPFCSERCKLIDLGEWASEKHRINGEQISESDDTESSEYYLNTNEQL